MQMCNKYIHMYMYECIHVDEGAYTFMYVCIYVLRYGNGVEVKKCWFCKKKNGLHNTKVNGFSILQLSSAPETSAETRDELDFEFLGNVSGEPYLLQTNIFTNGTGYKEQRIYLWFDPTADFHTYTISWTKEIVM